MRSLVATLLALGCLQPLQVAATCLANGTEPAALKNLVNPSGEAYPVGLFVGNWPGGLATSSLAGILIQEMLGYNVSYNGPGGSTTHGVYAISGCRNPTATTAEERGCDAKVTYNHITMEMWEAYPSLWADLQKNKAMAPKALTSMGYDGKTSTYLLKSVQESVAESEGLPLKFYTSYNANWWKPWLYFDNTSSVNATRFLKKCSETQIFSDSLMRNYLAQTGDSAGVQIIDGAVVGSCPDEYFWRAPSCRNETFKCVIFFTGGAGWSVHLIMQQATAWNMPIAMAIANTWGDFAAMPVAHRSLFYWWEPDPTFLELAPVEVIFPPHDRVGHANGDLKTAPSTIRLTKGVSKDLLSLAPRVENFLVNMEISMAMINAIMLDQKNTGDSWDDVTCRWLQGNKATWESWLPDDTTCFAGFGLVDIESGELAMDRTVREGKRCQACPSGTFSERLVDSIGVTYICSACPLGTSQASGASLKCEPCDKGTYQDELGSQSCKRCPLGTYQDQEGQAQCIACPDGSSTLGLGSVAFTDCGCVEGRIDVAPAGLTCEVCSVGLTCPAMGTLESYETGVHPLGTKYLPIVDAGYYTTAAEPLKVYKCGKTWHCPGGVPDSCAGGRAGVPCAECPQGKTWSEGQCMECEAWRQILWGISVVGVFLFLTASYYLMTSKVTAKASVLFTTTCAFGMLVSLLQSVGIIGMMTVEWPVDLKGFFSYFQVLLLDLDSFGFACFAGAETSFRYIVSVVFFPAAVSWLVMNFILSKVLPQHRRWGITKVASCSGQVLQVETSVQSLANDGIKAMAGQCVEGPVKKELVKALNEDFSNPEVQVPAGADDKAWPALTSLSALSRLARRPPASALGRFSGALQSPRRWAAPQLRVVVLSKDRWLHCFHLEASRLQALSAGGGATAPAHGTGIEGLEALEAEPQWSMYAPSTAVLPLHGRPRCFEVEVTKRSFLGLRSSRKEILQADTEDSFLRWVEVLLEAGAENRGIAVPSRPPPPPPPPQPIQESQHEDLPVAEDLHLAEDPQCEDLGQKVPKVEDGQDVAQGILEKQPEDPSETATRISNVLTTEGVFE